MSPRMNEPDAREISELVRRLFARPGELRDLASGDAWIVAGRGEALFDALVGAHRERTRGELEAIQATMRTLEGMWDESPATTAYLMARLYPLASGQFLHATCDGIELWMANAATEQVARRLEQLEGEGVPPALRRRCEQWRTWMRGK